MRPRHVLRALLSIGLGGAVAAALDITVKVTRTTDHVVSTTKMTTVRTTVRSTVVIALTKLVTATVTNKDAQTATLTNYVTSTVLTKRWIGQLPPETATQFSEAPAITAEAAPEIAAQSGLDLLRRNDLLEKRATVKITAVVPATRVTTLVKAVTSVVAVDRTTSQKVVTSTITTTLFPNAKTTVTVTSTIMLTVASLPASTQQAVGSAPATDSSDPTSTPSSGSNPNSDLSKGASSNGGKPSSGLSTAAVAGIVAGVGALVLAALAGVLAWCCRRRRKKQPAHDFDDIGGMSEVPIGSAAVGGSAAYRRSPVKPPSPPGYRGVEDPSSEYWALTDMSRSRTPAGSEFSVESGVRMTPTDSSLGPAHTPVSPLGYRGADDTGGGYWSPADLGRTRRPEGFELSAESGPRMAPMDSGIGVALTPVSSSAYHKMDDGSGGYGARADLGAPRRPEGVELDAESSPRIARMRSPVGVAHTTGAPSAYRKTEDPNGGYWSHGDLKRTRNPEVVELSAESSPHMGQMHPPVGVAHTTGARADVYEMPG